MTSGKAAAYGVGATLLVACLAAANMPSQDPAPRERAPRPAGTAGAESLAVEVRSQAARLHARMAQAPVPNPNPRNPFSFSLAPRAARSAMAREGMIRAAAAEEVAPPAVEPPLPALTLMGIAAETVPGGYRRTAVIALRQAPGDPEPSRVGGGDGDTIYMVTEGQPVGSRYKVTKIGADAVELEDLLTGGYRRIALK